MAHVTNLEPEVAEELPVGSRRHWAARISPVFARLVEIPAALLVVAEIVVLLAGILARYVFHKPIVWSDELAGILFLWLAMLGSVIAFQRGEHMRMTAIVGMLKPRARAFLDVVAIAAPLAFLLLVIHPAYEFAADEVYVTTPALEIANSWRAAALPVGIGLMLLFALLRLASVADWHHVAGAVVLVAALIGLMVLLAPVLKPLGNLNLLIFFVVLVGAMVFAAVPIAFAFGLATFGYIVLTTSTPEVVVIGRMDEGMSHLILLSVPLFVFLGLLIELTGMAGAMPGDLVALLSATGAQTETIPPSIVLITIGSVTGVSIAALFTGGLLPGVVLAITLCAVVWWRYRAEDLSHVKRATWREIGWAFLIAIPAVALPFVIRAAVIEGVATATEVSTIGIVYSVLAGLLIYRQFAWRRLYPMLVETAGLSGAILLIIGAATGMAWALTQSGFSALLAQFMTSLPGGIPTFLAVTIVAFVILGSVLEGIPAIVLFGPLLFPIAKQVGVHEVHYSMVVILAMGIGLFAPPFGVGYYAACAISRIHPDEGMGPIVGYMLALLIGTIIIAAVPWISIGFL